MPPAAVQLFTLPLAALLFLLASVRLPGDALPCGIAPFSEFLHNFLQFRQLLQRFADGVERVADLQQENEELKQSAAARASQLATLSLDLDLLKGQLGQVQATRDTLQCQVELHDTDLRLHQQSWSYAALKERSENALSTRNLPTGFLLPWPPLLSLSLPFG